MVRTLVLKFDARILVFVGALLVMLTAWLPWANLPSFVAGGLAQRGTDSGGLFTFGLALLAMLSLWLPWHPFRRVSLAAAILAALINLVALIALVRVIQLSGIVGIDLGAQLGSVGSGLYLTFAGLVLVLFGSLSEATPPSPFAPQIIDMVNPRQMEIVLRVALAGLLMASCLCAWGIGLLMRPYALVTPGPAQAETFRPVPTAYLATPLVDVQLAPLSTADALNSTFPTITPTRGNVALPATPTSAPGVAVASASPTPRKSQPTAPPVPTLFTEPTHVLPTIGAFTSTPPPSPLNTPTASATATTRPTETVTITATVAVTATATLTATATITASSNLVTP